MNDTERIDILEKKLKSIESKLNKDKKKDPDYKKKEPSEYNNFIKDFCAKEKLNLKEGEEYDHKKTFTKAALEWKSLKNKTN
jgi:hypothetical protein